MASTQEIDASMGIDAMLAMGFAFLEEHQWKKAQRYFDKAMEIAPQNPNGYLGRLLVTLKLANVDALVDSPRGFTGSDNFKKAMLYADDALKEKLNACVTGYQERCEREYQIAIEALAQATTRDDFYKCIDMFYKLGNYKDSMKKREYCHERLSALAQSVPPRAYQTYQMNPRPQGYEEDETKADDEKEIAKTDSTVVLTDNGKKKSKINSTIVCIIACVFFSILFAITGFFIESDIDETLMIVAMIVIGVGWVVSFFGIFISALIKNLKKNFPDTYKRLFSTRRSAVTGKAPKNIFVRIWNTPVIMYVLAVVVLLAGAAVSGISGHPVSFLCVELICIVVGLIIGFATGSQRMHKILFIATFVGIAILVGIILMESMGGSSSSGGPCPICGGDGIFFDKICFGCGGWGE